MSAHGVRERRPGAGDHAAHLRRREGERRFAVAQAQNRKVYDLAVARVEPRELPGSLGTLGA